MGKFSLNDLDKFQGGASKYFKLDDGQELGVRFLYNTVDEIINSVSIVHEFAGTNFATIACGRVDDADTIESCKWCQRGEKPLMRVIIPIYLEDTKEIQYWKRSGSWVTDNLLPLVRNLPVGAPISGQIFRIGRKGKDMRSTTYTLAPDMRFMNDQKTSEQFGVVEDPITVGIIKPTDYEFPVTNNQTSDNSVATRRTADIF